MMNRTTASLLLACMAASAHAAEVYTHIGTEGLGLGVGRPIGAAFGVRGEINAGSLSHDIDYDAKLKWRGIGFYGDWYPVPSPFRLTAGIVFNDSKVAATGTSDTVLVINGQSYTAAGEAVYGRIEWPSVMPYIGVGLGHARERRGWGLFADLGVMIGKPKARLTATPGLLQQVSAAELEAERRELQDKADDYGVYPVLKIGVSYTF
jgi:hypothetical protein